MDDDGIKVDSECTQFVSAIRSEWHANILYILQHNCRKHYHYHYLVGAFISIELLDEFADLMVVVALIPLSLDLVVSTINDMNKRCQQYDWYAQEDPHLLTEGLAVNVPINLQYNKVLIPCSKLFTPIAGTVLPSYHYTVDRFYFDSTST